MTFAFTGPGDRRWSLKVLGGRPYVLGSDPNWCDLHLSDAGLSRVHCGLSVEGAWGWIEDLGSSDGTFINGRRVVSSPVCRGDIIRIGTCSIEVR